MQLFALVCLAHDLSVLVGHAAGCALPSAVVAWFARFHQGLSLATLGTFRFLVQCLFRCSYLSGGAVIDA